MSGDVKPGYKQTEVGVIPEDWDVGELGLFWSVTDCKHVTAPFIANGFPIASIREVQSRFVDLTNAKQTTPQFYALLIEGGRKPNIGDLILSRNATVGEVAQVAEWHPPFAMGQDVCLLRKKSSQFSTNYLQSVFRSTIIANQLSDLMVGSTFKRANIEQIKNFVVPMPSASEQEAIAEALSDADALIESLTQLIAKKRQIKQGAMQELLTGKRRLHGFANVTSGYKQTEVGLIPEDWAIRKLGTLLAEPPTYGINAPAISYDTRYPTYLRITDISDDGRFIEESKASVSHPEAGKYILNAGDLVLARTGASVGKSYLCIPTDGVLVFAGFLIRVRPNDEKLSSSYLKFYTQSRVYWNWVTVNSMRSGQPGINGQEYAVLPIPIPSTRVEQDAIAEVLSEMDAEITALETKLAKARQLKQGMMHNLLTGRIRLV
jgi:type I restriction enzyme, S subunit